MEGITVGRAELELEGARLELEGVRLELEGGS